MEGQIDTITGPKPLSKMQSTGPNNLQKKQSMFSQSNADQSDGWGNCDDDDDMGDWECDQIINTEPFILKEADQIIQVIPRITNEVCEFFNCTEDEALIMLRHYKFNIEKLQNEWFDNEGLQKAIGLEYDTKIAKDNPEVEMSLREQNEGYCIVCYNEFDDDLFKCVSISKCKHEFCKSCWVEYLKNKVNEGPHAVHSMCMQDGCNCVVPHSFFNTYLEGPAFKKYEQWHCKAFTDDNKNVKWCPYKNCNVCVERTEYGHGLTVVDCKCGEQFCFKCGMESHSPADCEDMKKWDQKNSAESENVTWIIANTKPCPQCSQPIEKNHGCNHMHCTKCNYDFCWMCLGNWKDHGSSTGGYYKCNKYESAKTKGEESKFMADEKKAEKAATELKRYMFYFERFNNHQKSEKIARDQQAVMVTKIQALHDDKNYPLNELNFLSEAIFTVIKCRQVLKSTYVYGYYRDFNKNQPNEKELFEYLQQLLEETCDRLHEDLEKPMDQYLDKQVLDRTPFYQFKSKLLDLSQTTDKYYKGILDGLRKGLTTA